MNKLQDWKTNLTRKQRVILLIVVGCGGVGSADRHSVP